MIYDAEKQMDKMDKMFQDFKASDPFDVLHSNWRNSLFNEKELEDFGYKKNEKGEYELEDISQKDENGKECLNKYKKEEKYFSSKKMADGKEITYTKKTIKDSDGTNDEEIIEETKYPDGHKEIKEIKNGKESIKALPK